MSVDREVEEMMIAQASENLVSAAEERLDRVLAKVRDRQLKLAIEGRVVESENYANRAERIRRLADVRSLNLAS